MIETRRLGEMTMYGEVLRIVEAIHKDKDIEKEVIFQGIESALQSAAKKKYGTPGDLRIKIDRQSGEIFAFTKDGERVDPPDFGRIAAQTAKQLIIQKIREAERDVIYGEFENKKKDIVIGYVHRIEGLNLIVNLGKTEAVLPKQEQVPDEHYHPGDRIRAYVLEVKKIGQKVKIILSRTHPNFIKKLFELEVPEISQNIIEINNVVREAGYRTKIAVSSKDEKVDCVGACVGVRGARIKSIIDELGGEKIDIIRWDDEPKILIENALKPADISSIVLDHNTKKAKVVVADDQLSLAIGKKGQNVRLAAKLCKWDIDILTESQDKTHRKEVIEELISFTGLSEEKLQRLYEKEMCSIHRIMACESQELSQILELEILEIEDLKKKIGEKIEESGVHLLKEDLLSSEVQNENFPKREENDQEKEEKNQLEEDNDQEKENDQEDDDTTSDTYEKD